MSSHSFTQADNYVSEKREHTINVTHLLETKGVLCCEYSDDPQSGRGTTSPKQCTRVCNLRFKILFATSR